MLQPLDSAANFPPTIAALLRAASATQTAVIPQAIPLIFAYVVTEVSSLLSITPIPDSCAL